jgi:hypothetical protein
MSRNPDGASAGFYSQAGATAYLIDPAGAYSPSGASAPTTDPAGTDDVGTDDGAGASAPALAAAGVYIPIAGATSAAAEIVDPTVSYRLAAASAPTTAPASAKTMTQARGRSRSPQRTLRFRSRRRRPRRRSSTPRAPTVWRARVRRRPIRPAGAPPLAPARRRSRPLARTLQQPGRPPPRRRLALTVWPARRRPIRRAETAPPPARQCSRPRARPFQRPEQPPPRHRFSPCPAHTSLRARPRRRPTQEARTPAPTPPCDDGRGRHIQQPICVEPSICNIYKHNPLQLHSVVSKPRPGGALLWRLQSGSLPGEAILC